MRLLLLAQALGVNGSRCAGSAVDKTISLLNKMVEEGQKATDEEQVAWAARETWCTGTIQTLAEEIETLVEDKAGQEAAISAADGKMSELSELIVEEQGKVSTALKRKAFIKAEREKTHEAFLVEQKDLTESVSALDRAIIVIAQHQKQYGKVEQASFMQASVGIPSSIKIWHSVFWRQQRKVLKSTQKLLRIDPHLVVFWSYWKKL